MTTRSSGPRGRKPTKAKPATKARSTKAKGEASVEATEIIAEDGPLEAATDDSEPDLDASEPEEFVPETLAPTAAEFQLEEIAEHILRAVVSNQQALSVVRENQPDKVRLAISVAPEDLGKVIGKQGRTINALRAVVKTAAARTETPVVVDLEGKPV